METAPLIPPVRFAQLRLFIEFTHPLFFICWSTPYRATSSPSHLDPKFGAGKRAASVLVPILKNVSLLSTHFNAAQSSNGYLRASGLSNDLGSLKKYLCTNF
ncbi:hypothetical protein CEXT_346941 [Caerostris extrusa]|uniref:Uncharacterized protein n=1 Tax=Caerostris extrusa TaxID=172846 RepID=A0AAV4V7Z7_CAEEX|nr:hypothetical protein CEXT_346941 [Caerostris extrusa]